MLHKLLQQKSLEQESQSPKKENVSIYMKVIRQIHLNLHTFYEFFKNIFFLLNDRLFIVILHVIYILFPHDQTP